MKKGIVIKMKDGKYKLYCKDRDWAVFAKLTNHKDGSSSINFNKTVTMSSLPQFRHYITEKLV